MSKPRIEEALEMARCAEINLSNLADALPGIARLPIFQIVKLQLKDAIAHPEGNEVAEGP